MVLNTFEIAEDEEDDRLARGQGSNCLGRDNPKRISYDRLEVVFVYRSVCLWHFRTVVMIVETLVFLEDKANPGLPSFHEVSDR